MRHLPKNLYDCLEYPKTCAPDDFWGQIRRTINGKPIPQEQIELIFSMIHEALHLQQSDVLLDIACGNGRLGYEFFNQIDEYLGVDLSPCLIEIAQKNFERCPTHTFLQQSINAYCKEERHPTRFTSALWYGAFAYLSSDEAFNALTLLRTRFSNIKTLFIGTIPNTESADIFFQGKEPLPLNDHTTAIGRWYTRGELIELAEKCGWGATIVEMPKIFYQAHYRFNAILTPRH